MTAKPGKMPAAGAVYLLYCCGLCLLLGLGAWQLARGLEKTALEQRIAARGAGMIAVTGPDADWQSLAYATVRLHGTWLPERTLLLDNRVHNGRLGVEVFTPLALGAGAILVNRGWVPRPPGSALDPALLQVAADTPAEGRLYLPEPGFTLGPAFAGEPTFPALIQYLDMAQLSELLAMPLVRAAVVLDRPAPGFKTIWQPYVMDARRHFGYAVQWWGLAAVMLVFGLLWRRGRRTVNRAAAGPVG